MRPHRTFILAAGVICSFAPFAVAKPGKNIYAREGTWTLAVACYHAGPNNNPAQKRYVCRAIGNRIVTGFGEWTPQAKGFCGK